MIVFLTQHITYQDMYEYRHHRENSIFSEECQESENYSQQEIYEMSDRKRKSKIILNVFSLKNKEY